MKYNEYMENVKLTEEMKKRIMEGVNKKMEKEKNEKMISYKKVISIAACFVMVFTISLLLKNNPNNVEKENENGNGGNVQIAADIVDYNTIDELSKKLNFTMKEVASVPFTVNKTTYTSYWGEMGQITYESTANELTFRMEKNTDDPSGDYNEYKNTENVEIDGNSVTLKGENGKYQLAIWKNGEFGYSLSVQDGITKDEIVNAVKSVK